jgi:hypothetical protein
MPSISSAGAWTGWSRTMSWLLVTTIALLG